MHQILSRFAVFAVALVAMHLPPQAAAAGVTHTDTLLSVQIAVRDDKAMFMDLALQGDPRFSGCYFVLGGQQARKGHDYFVDHFVPEEDSARQGYIVLYYNCDPAKDDHFSLFQEKAVNFAKQNPEYVLRLLFDTIKHDEGNCPTVMCPIDGSPHHTHPSRPCKYQC